MNRRLALALVAIFLGATILGCAQKDASIEGRPCPCPTSGFTCDSVCNVCVSVDVAPGTICGDSGVGGSSGSSGAGGIAGMGGNCTPKITFSDFHAVWTTPESIRWEWTPDQEVAAIDSFQSYELELTSDDNVVVTFDSSTNPELGVYAQPNGAPDLTYSSVTRDLTRSEYTARLRAIDTSGCASESQVVFAPAMPIPKGGALDVYGDQPPAGSTLDASEVTDGSGCRTGSRCLVSADPGAGFCNIRWEMTTAATPTFTAGEFTQAYLEFWMRSTETTPHYWADGWLETVGGAFWISATYAAPADGNYHKFQIPLRWLTNDAQVQLAYDDVSSGITSVNLFGSACGQGSIWIDDAYVRW